MAKPRWPTRVGEILPPEELRESNLDYNQSPFGVFREGCRHPAIIEFMLQRSPERVFKAMAEQLPAHVRREKIKENPQLLLLLPSKLWTKSLVKLALEVDYLIWHRLPRKIRQDPELQEMAVRSFGVNLQWVPYDDRNWKLSLMAIQQNPMAVKFVPEGFLMEPEMRQALKDIEGRKL